MLNGSYFGPFGLGQQIFLDQKGNILIEGVDEGIESALFNEEKLELLVELLIDLSEFAVEDADPFGGNDVVIHEDGGQTLDDLQDLFRVQ